MSFTLCCDFCGRTQLEAPIHWIKVEAIPAAGSPFVDLGGDYCSPECLVEQIARSFPALARISSEVE